MNITMTTLVMLLATAIPIKVAEAQCGQFPELPGPIQDVAMSLLCQCRQPVPLLRS